MEWLNATCLASGNMLIKRLPSVISIAQIRSDNAESVAHLGGPAVRYRRLVELGSSADSGQLPW